MILRDEALGEWLGHKGAALVNGISALIKEAQESPHPVHHVRPQWENAIHAAEIGAITSI